MRLGIASTFPPYRGGIAQFNAAAARALLAAGHEVVTVTWSRQYPKLLFPGTSQWEPGKSLSDVEMPALLDCLSPVSGIVQPSIWPSVVMWLCCLFGMQHLHPRSQVSEVKQASGHEGSLGLDAQRLIT